MINYKNRLGKIFSISWLKGYGMCNKTLWREHIIFKVQPTKLGTSVLYGRD